MSEIDVEAVNTGSSQYVFQAASIDGGLGLLTGSRSSGELWVAAVDGKKPRLVARYFGALSGAALLPTGSLLSLPGSGGQTHSTQFADGDIGAPVQPNDTLDDGAMFRVSIKGGATFLVNGSCTATYKLADGRLYAGPGENGDDLFNLTDLAHPIHLTADASDSISNGTTVVFLEDTVNRRLFAIDDSVAAGSATGRISLTRAGGDGEVPSRHRD